MDQPLGAIVKSVGSLPEGTSGTGRSVLFLSLAAILVGFGLSGCSRHHGATHPCEPPGTLFAYSDANSMLIGGMIAHAAAEPLPAFARKNLFGPLGITDYCWTLTPVGQPMTDGSFYIRPRDFLKLGQLYLDGGVWHGRRVVSKSWVAESTRSHWPMERPESKGVRLDYGYQWRSRHLQPGVNPRFYYYLAAGGGAQLLVVFAKLDLVIVFTGGRYGTTVGERQHSALLNTFIVRSLGL